MTTPVINGFLCSNDRALIGVKTFAVPGTGVLPGRQVVKLALRADVAPLLLELFRFWHAEIEPLDIPPIDDWGYAARTVRGSNSPSFHWAGIAGDGNALKHPLSKRGTLTADQVRRLTRKADTLGVRLGANYTGRVDAMHAEIIVTVARALELVRALQLPGGSTPPPPTLPPSGGQPVLRLGSRGAAVEVAQAALARKGFDPGGVDGKFELRTDRAVRDFQRAAGLPVDGIVGRRTWTVLTTAGPPPVTPPPPPRPSRWPEISLGSKGSAVGVMQRFLGLVADNDFGPKMDRAVRDYQKLKGLKVDGKVGPATWSATGL